MFNILKGSSWVIFPRVFSLMRSVPCQKKESKILRHPLRY